MKNITSEQIKKFIQSNEPQYSSTQTKFCLPIIRRMCAKMFHGIKFDDIKICEDLIIDGHHRYLSALLMNVEIGSVASQRTSATKSVHWSAIEFDENDWDKEAKILYLNEQDALYNDLTIEFLKQITSE